MNSEKSDCVSVSIALFPIPESDVEPGDVLDRWWTWLSKMVASEVQSLTGNKQKYCN